LSCTEADSFGFSRYEHEMRLTHDSTTGPVHAIGGWSDGARTTGAYGRLRLVGTREAQTGTAGPWASELLVSQRGQLPLEPWRLSPPSPTCGSGLIAVRLPTGGEIYRWSPAA